MMKGPDRKVERYASLAVEYGLYLYIFWLMFDKGEGMRNTGLYTALAGWLAMVLLSKKVNLSPDVVTASFLVYLGSTFLSTLFSVDPAYSFFALKQDVVKATISFFVISTCFDDRMLLRMSNVIIASGLIILAFGLYNFVFNDADVYTSQNAFLDVDKNEYGFFLGFILPFYIMPFLRGGSGWKKILWGTVSLWVILGTILSASRGAMGNVFSALMVFIVFTFKRKHAKILFVMMLISVVLVIFSFEFWPEELKFRVLSTPQHLSTFDDRTVFFWRPAVEAVKKRPFLGWGYGKKLARDPRPFEGGEMPDLEKKGQLHSTFITNLFHQGIVGLVSYLLLLFSAVFVLLRMVRSETGDRRVFALALLGVIVGSFLVNSFLRTVAFRTVTPVLAMAAALYRNRTNVIPDSGGIRREH